MIFAPELAAVLLGQRGHVVPKQHRLGHFEPKQFLGVDLHALAHGVEQNVTPQAAVNSTQSPVLREVSE